MGSIYALLCIYILCIHIYYIICNNNKEKESMNLNRSGLVWTEVIGEKDHVTGCREEREEENEQFYFY